MHIIQDFKSILQMNIENYKVVPTYGAMWQ